MLPVTLWKTRGAGLCALFGLFSWWSGLVADSARADEPPEIAASRKISSGSCACWAFTDAAAKKTTGFRSAAGKSPNGKAPSGKAPDGKRTKGEEVALWTLPGWYRVAALSRDCEYFVTGYDGVNLLPLDFDRATIMLAFYKQGRLIRALRLDQLIADLSKLRRTDSHFEWGSYIGVEKEHYYRVQTVDRGPLLFDMATGQIVSSAP